MGQKSGDDRLGISEGAQQRAEVDPILRAKYLDYCSAQVAEVLLGMSPDEIFVLARDAAQARGTEEAPSYDAMVQLATARIYRKLELPRFQAWISQYNEDPARFESEILGIWESEPGLPRQRS